MHVPGTASDLFFGIISPIMDGVGVVERKIMKLNLPEGGLKLAYGGVLKEVNVAYEECGAPLDGYNAIYICHALTGDAHVAGFKPGEEKPSGWWEGMVGPGRAIDTNKYHVICANVLGGCSGTTGPMSLNPETGKPYGSTFPQYTFDDAVDVFRMLLKQLGVKKLAALIGGSYGGLQVVNWMTRYPDEMEKVCLIATSAALNTQAIALSVMSRNSITDDPNWKGGDYYDEAAPACGQGPRAGLASARQLAHITYLSRELLQQKFQRKLQQNFVDAPAAVILTRAGVDCGLAAEGTWVEAEAGYLSSKDPFERALVRNGKCRLLRAGLKEGAKVMLSAECAGADRRPQTFALAYRYANAEGRRFLVYLYDGMSLHCASGLVRGYLAQRVIFDGYRFLAGKNPPVFAHGHPDLYLGTARGHDGSLSLLVANCYADPILRPVFTLDRDYAAVESATDDAVHLEGRRLVFDRPIPAMDFRAVRLTAEKSDIMSH